MEVRTCRLARAFLSLALRVERRSSRSLICSFRVVRVSGEVLSSETWRAWYTVCFPTGVSTSIHVYLLFCSEYRPHGIRSLCSGVGPGVLWPYTLVCQLRAPCHVWPIHLVTLLCKFDEISMAWFESAIASTALRHCINPLNTDDCSTDCYLPSRI